jgi:L-seryl-tRNA(Ser) seleniumtransferase
VDLAKLGLPIEPTVPGSLAAGADLVCSSGDKLVGGPQAGIIVGKKELITRIKKHPLTRMLRVCKLTDIALEKTLRLFLDPKRLIQNHPTLHMMTVQKDVLKKRAFQLKKALDKAQLGLLFEVKEGESAVGGGTMPDHPLPTYLLAVDSPSLSAQKLSRLLRENDFPVITRILKNKVVFDMRTLLKGEDKIILEAVKRIASSSSLVKSG